jgi:phage/plasmid-associated DNA primase
VVKTGKVSGITVFDFDDNEIFTQLREEYPDLNDDFIVYTKRGAHVYYQYDEDFRSPTTNVLFYKEKVQNVDIRNDNGIVLCPPTRYKLSDSSYFSYTYNSGTLRKVPDWLRGLVLPQFIVRKRQRTGQQQRRSQGSIESDSEEEDEHVEQEGDQHDNAEGLGHQPHHTNETHPKWESFLKLKELISVSRLSVYEEWIKITCAIYNTFGDRAKNIWDELSRKSPSYDKQGNDKVWKHLRRNKIPRGGSKKATFDVIVLAAKEDSPDEYAELTQNIDSGIDWSNGLNHVNYARSMKELFFADGSLLFCGSSRPIDGFVFNGIYWQQLDPNRAHLKQKYIPKLFDHYTNALRLAGPYMNEKVLAKLNSDLNNLKSMPYINNIIQALEIECYEVNDIPWNHNIYLFAFNDVIVDLRSKDFIEPNVSDYINCTCGYDFFQYDAMGNRLEHQPLYEEETQEIHDFFDSIVVNEDVKDYLLSQISSFLVQENPSEKAYFWLGNGRNGKGAATQLLRSAFGKYFSELKLEYYTKTNSGPDSPNCNLFNCRYARVLNTSEVGEDELHPDRPQKFLTEKLKTLTGRDPLTTRKPHSADEVKFLPGHPLIQTNIMPTLPGIHLADSVSLRERIEIIQFPFSFVTDLTKVRLEPQKYKLQNSELKSLFAEDRFRNAFIRILMRLYGEVVETPPEVISYRQAYFDENDIVKSWFESTFSPLPGGLTTDFSNIKFNLKHLFQESDIKGRSFDQFKKEITHLAGKRSTTNRKGTRGVYQNGNDIMLQGYQFISQDFANDMPPVEAPRMRFH